MSSRRFSTDLTLAVLALIGVAALHLAALVSAPPLISLADAAAHEGDRIQVEARVLDVLPTRGGAAARLTLVADGWRLTAWGDRAAAGRDAGDHVRAAGVLSRDDAGAWALDIEQLEVVAAAATRAHTSDDVARDPAGYDGARLLVVGEVRGHDLVGIDARLPWRGPAPPDPTGVWAATGTFRYDARHFSYQFNVEAWHAP